MQDAATKELNRFVTAPSRTFKVMLRYDFILLLHDMLAKLTYAGFLQLQVSVTEASPTRAEIHSSYGNTAPVQR